MILKPVNRHCFTPRCSAEDKDGANTSPVDEDHQRSYSEEVSTGRPRIVRERILYVVDGPERPTILGYPEIPLSYCNHGCARRGGLYPGFRFQGENHGKCRREYTCFYSRVVYRETLLKWCRRVGLCRYCCSTYVRTGSAEDDNDGPVDTCRSDRCDAQWYAEHPGELVCQVCGQPCPRRTVVTNAFLRDAALDRPFVGNEYRVCLGRCEEQLRATITGVLVDELDEALCGPESDSASHVSAEKAREAQRWLSRNCNRRGRPEIAEKMRRTIDRIGSPDDMP